MRKLMWTAMGFTLSCGLMAYGMGCAWVLPLAILCIMSFAVAAAAGQKMPQVRPLAALLLGCTMGLGWFSVYQQQYLEPVRVLDRQVRFLEFTALDYSEETDFGVRVEGDLTAAGRRYQIRAYLEEGVALSPGDRVSGLFRLRVTAPNAPEASRYYQGEGVFLLCYQTEAIHISPAEEIPLRCCPALLRQQIRQLLEAAFPEDVYPFVKALLLGDSSDLDYETDTAFKVSGIRHIIAVSGLHISILYSLVTVIALRRRFLTALIGLPVLLLFTAVAGFTPSVTRACIMLCLMLLAQTFDREYDAPTALAFAVLVMLMANPLAVTSVSLQLSVLCVAGILLFNSPINEWLKSLIPERKGLEKLRGSLCGSIAVTLSSMSLVTPLSAWYFGAVSLVGILTNLLTLWVVNLVFNGITAVCLLGLMVPMGARLLAGLLAWPARFVLWTAKALSALPLAAVYTESLYLTLWLIFVYILLGVFLLSRKKQPVTLICCGILGLCMVLTAAWAETMFTDTRITMLDVGQGQSILLESKGKSFLVDCGGDDEESTADTIANVLLSRGIFRLDGMILTHYDRDHSGALENLLSRVDTKLLFLPDTHNDMTLPETDAQILYVWEDLELTFGTSRLMIYGPVYSGYDNENSLCVLFDTEKCDILITGDRSAFGERMLLRRAVLPDVDILAAGHHGAADSTSAELLNAVRPEIVLISVGQDNIYGHPAAELLQRLNSFGCTVYRTDESGTITIRR